MEKRWIFFDAMGVIFTVGDDTNELLVPFVQKYNPQISRDYINQEYLSASLGEITSQEFWNRMKISEEGKEEEVCHEYLNTCLSIDENFIPVAEKLSLKYHLAILSNDVSEWSEYLRKIKGIDKLVKLFIISGDVKCRKPNEEIYTMAIRQANVRPANCVFIDDREKNLFPARQQGMKVIKFQRGDIYDETSDFITIGSFLKLEQELGKLWEW